MRSNNKVSFVCKYRVVWCPKYRRQVLVKGADIRFKAIIRDVCRERSAELIEVEVMPDHVHLLEVDPQFGIHRLVKAIKGRSLRLLRQEFPQCREKADEMPLSVRSWICGNCGSEHDRDVNAAINIPRIGILELRAGGFARPCLRRPA